MDIVMKDEAAASVASAAITVRAERVPLSASAVLDKTSTPDLISLIFLNNKGEMPACGTTMAPFVIVNLGNVEGRMNPIDAGKSESPHFFSLAQI